MERNSQDFVTVAVLQNAAEANFLKNQLEAVGITTYLADEETVAMAWHMTGALGGVKVQVAALDADDALAFLDRRPWHGDSNVGVALDAVEAADARADEEEPLSDREHTAQRACRAAVFGVLFWPLEIYALWLLCKVYFSPERLEGRARSNAKVGGVINTLVLFGSCATVAVFMQGPVEPEIDLRELPHPRILVGTWKGQLAVGKEEVRLWMRIKSDGVVDYRESGSVPLSCQGTWAFKAGRLLVHCERIQEGASTLKGKLLSYNLQDVRDSSLTLWLGSTKVPMNRVE